MLTRLWTIGVKVPDLEKELAFHRQMGNSVVLDETLELDGQRFRLPLIRMGDKYMHIAEKMVYESLLGQAMPFGITHLVYRSNSFDEDVLTAVGAGATALREPATISAGFGDRRVAFFRAPGGWIFEIIEVLRDLVPEV
jgi:catechol 2,3-dioxygenase-like lactoylglutathione lyase family enzyme